MSTFHSEEMAPSNLYSRRPFNSGYELFWSRAPIVLISIMWLMVCCALVSLVWSIVIGSVVVLVLLAVVTAEFLDH